MSGRIINVKVLPGQPLDGSGIVCIHLFVPDAAGSFTEPCATQIANDENGHPRLTTGPARGRLACDRRRTVAPIVRGNVVTVTMRSGDPRAVTCHKCKASADFKALMEKIEPTAADAAK